MATVTKIEKAMSILNENGLLPNGIDLYTRLKLIDFKSDEYAYWGNKYAEGSKNYQNAAVALQFKHTMVEKPFWIVLFRGAQCRETNVEFVAGFWNLPNISDAIYAEHGIQEQDQEDGVETILEIVEKFDYLWFTQDDANKDIEPIMWQDSEMISWLAYNLLDILNIQVNISISETQINESHIILLESALEKAKEAYSQQSKYVGVEQFKNLLEKTDAISIDGSPLLTNIESDEDMLIDTQWNEDDLLFECHYSIEDIKQIKYNPNDKKYELSIEGGETCKFELFNLNRVEAA